MILTILKRILFFSMARSRASFFIGFLLFLCWGGIFLYAAGESVLLKGIFGNNLPTGSFDPNGNAGIVDFENPPFPYNPSEYSEVQIIKNPSNTGELFLTGMFWMQTVGWSTFADVGSWPVYVIPPGSGSNIRNPTWYLSGYAWNENAGWLALNHGDNNASWVTYLPDTSSFTGYAWSDTLWWISFSSGSFSVARGFIWQVKVTGNIWWSKTFDVWTLWVTPGKSFDSLTLNNIINNTRKNVAILLRNAGTWQINTIGQSNPNSFVNTMFFRSLSNNTDTFLSYSGAVKNAFNTDNSKTLLSIGADIYIDTDFTGSIIWDNPRSIIALKNDAWQGWDIYISGNVKRIDATIVAEGTLWSGYNQLWQLVPYYKSKASAFIDIPKTQLWILGSVISHNTIGWWSKDGGAICPYTTDSIVWGCTYDTALPYDLNYFRWYTGSNEWRAYKNTSLDAYSMIIDYDPRILSDPPPGLSNLP